jgi:hypothetical protein
MLIFMLSNPFFELCLFNARPSPSPSLNALDSGKTAQEWFDFEVNPMMARWHFATIMPRCRAGQDQPQSGLLPLFPVQTVRISVSPITQQNPKIWERSRNRNRSTNRRNPVP